MNKWGFVMARNILESQLQSIRETKSLYQLKKNVETDEEMINLLDEKINQLSKEEEEILIKMGVFEKDKITLC